MKIQNKINGNLFGEFLKCWKITIFFLVHEIDVCLSFVVDLFEKLVPLPVYEALTAFENRKTQIMNTEIGRLREQTQLMNR